MAEYIERQAVEKFIENGLNNPDKDKAFGFDAVEILAEVHYMPAADVAPVRHGWWNSPYITFLLPLKIKNPYCFCSNCVYAVRRKRTTDYCPSCGAKMDLEDRNDR